MDRIPETAGTTIVQCGLQPYSDDFFMGKPRPPHVPSPDPLELWSTCMDPSTISVEAVVVYETRDLDPQYARKPPVWGVDDDAYMDYIDKVKLATSDLILTQCSNPVDLTSIQNGEEVKSGPDVYMYFHRAKATSCFTTVKHLKNPRWKWVEELVDAYKPLCPITYEREPVQTQQAQQDDVADVNANQYCALA